MEDYYDNEEWDWRVDRFADPGGTSALHPSTKDDPRVLSCPTCGWPNRLTGRDKAKGYQCDSCADANEQGRDIDYHEEDE